MEEFFNNPLLFGEGFINSIPRFGVFGQVIFDFFTFLGNKYFFPLIMAVIYWCIDRDLAFKVGIIYLASNIVNLILKLSFHNPRPIYDKLSEEVKMLRENHHHTSYGFPSGHTMNSFVFFFTIAHHYKKIWLWVAGFIFAIAISFSRLYLGVHYLGDVLGGLVFAVPFMILIAIGLFDSRKLLTELNKIFLILIFLVIPFVLVLFLTNPMNKGILEAYGVLCGFALGIGLSGKFEYKVKTTIPKQLLKVLIGVAGIGIILFLLKIPFDMISGSIYLDFVRYYLSGFWVTFLTPLIFSKIPILSKKTK